MLRIPPSLIGVVAEDVAGYVAQDCPRERASMLSKPVLRQGAARSRDAAVTISDSRTPAPRRATPSGSSETDRERPYLEGTEIDRTYPTALQHGSEEAQADQDPFRSSMHDRYHRQDISYSPTTASLRLAYQPKRDSAIAVPRAESRSPQSPHFHSYPASHDEGSGPIEKQHVTNDPAELCTAVQGRTLSRKAGDGLRRYHARSCSDPSEPPPLRYKPVTSRKHSIACANNDKLSGQHASVWATHPMLEQPSYTVKEGPYSSRTNSSIGGVERPSAATTEEPRPSSKVTNASVSTSSPASSPVSTSTHRPSNSTPFDQTFGNVPSPLEQLAKEVSTIPSSSLATSLPVREVDHRLQDAVPFPSFKDPFDTEPPEGYHNSESSLYITNDFAIDASSHPPAPRLRRSLGRRRSRTPALRANTISSHEGDAFRSQEVEAGLVRQRPAGRRRVHRSNSEQENGEELERFGEERRAWAAQREGSQGGAWEHTPPRQGRLEQFL